MKKLFVSISFLAVVFFAVMFVLSNVSVAQQRFTQSGVIPVQYPSHRYSAHQHGHQHHEQCTCYEHRYSDCPGFVPAPGQLPARPEGAGSEHAGYGFSRSRATNYDYSVTTAVPFPVGGKETIVEPNIKIKNKVEYVPTVTEELGLESPLFKHKTTIQFSYNGQIRADRRDARAEMRALRAYYNGSTNYNVFSVILK